MSPKSMDERIVNLEQIIAKQQLEIERLEARQQCENVMGRYEYFHCAGKNKRIVEDLFAIKNPDSTAEISERGVYVGEKGIRRLFEGAIASSEGDPIGYSTMHMLCTPVIEVAKDGKTAKGVWMAPGHRVVRDQKTGKPKGSFKFTRHEAEFIKEDGKWKLLHWHSYPFLSFPIEIPEEKRKERKVGSGDFVVEFPSDRPTTYYKPYDPNGINENDVPFPPDPY